jgi:predicted phage terminase large subunit-like protein
MAARAAPSQAASSEAAHPAAAPAQEIRPQPGPQELILSTPADVGIIGGSVFGGKTWALVIEALRNIDVKGFTFVGFRREVPEITNPGGLWDESLKWYPLLGGLPRAHVHEWDFPAGASGKFAGLQHEKDKESWKGASVCLFLFDQLETFSESTFFYMFSRNRSDCGVQPYIRASCNPDPDSFLAQFLAWWIDKDGWAIPELSGVIRWFIRVNDVVTWSSVTCAPHEYPDYEARKAAAREELTRMYGDDGRFASSVTFVLARLQDNAIGRRLDPEYEGKVRALPFVDRERLLGGDRGGNWKIRATAGKVFNRAWFRSYLKARPQDVVQWVRYWDKAGTEEGGKFTAGVLMGRRANGRYLLAHIIRGQWSAGEREERIRQAARADAALGTVSIWVEQEPGSGGKESAENTVINLAGYTIHAERVTGSKVVRAGPFSAQAEAGNIDILDPLGDTVNGVPALEAFLVEAQNFDGIKGFTDQIDAASGAFNKLTQARPMQKVKLAGFG